MAFTYQQLSQDEMDTIIAENMHGREVEHFHHELNAATYAALMAAPSFQSAPPEWQARITQLRTEAQAEMVKIRGLYAALSAQLSDPTRQAAAIARAGKRRKIREALQYQPPAAATVDESVLN